MQFKGKKFKTTMNKSCGQEYNQTVDLEASA
jgi:hypothetical protein